MARSWVKDGMGVVERCPKLAHTEAISPSSIILCSVYHSGGLRREREGLDKRPAFKHAIVVLFFWSRNGWYEQLVIVGNVPASPSPVKSATRPSGLALVTMGEKCRLSEWPGLSGYSTDSKGVARSWKWRTSLIQPPNYHLCCAHTKAAPSCSTYACSSFPGTQ